VCRCHEQIPLENSGMMRGMPGGDRQRRLDDARYALLSLIG